MYTSGFANCFNLLLGLLAKELLYNSSEAAALSLVTILLGLHEDSFVQCVRIENKVCKHCHRNRGQINKITDYPVSTPCLMVCNCLWLNHTSAQIGKINKQ